VNSLVAGMARLRRLRVGAPGSSVRVRLTLFYAALFLICGAALLALTYALVAHRYHGGLFTTTRHNALARVPGRPITLKAVSSVGLVGLIVESSIALAIMSVVCLWLGWLVAGRVLRPLRTITDAVQAMSASDLHLRLALGGPDDELRQLGTTFNELLERLEAAFESQRRFIAHASHELRTPLTLQRALVQVALTNPDADNASLREMGEEVLAAGDRQERLIDALLTLARSQAGPDRHEPVELSALTQDVLDELDHDQIAVEARLEPATANGDPDLLERLISNVLSNAIRHNHRGGRVAVATGTAVGSAVLTVTNTGPIITTDQISRLFAPFQRLERPGADSKEGSLGLGLTIIDAIAAAHHAELTVRPSQDGGLHVEIRFPAPTKT
jgi:signal transduction histidine kinase